MLGGVEKQASPAQFLIGVAVMLAWFAAPVVLVVRWFSRQSTSAPEECSAWCSDDHTGALAAAIVLGVPAAAVGLIVGAVVFAVLIPRAWPGLVTGTVAGVAGLLAGPAAVLCVMSAVTLT
jgi:hypothetical protein